MAILPEFCGHQAWLGSEVGLTKIAYCPSFLLQGSGEDSVSGATAHNCTGVGDTSHSPAPNLELALTQRK